MEQTYELVIGAQEARLVATQEPIDVGDALILDREILLVLRESERAATLGRARFECRCALQLNSRSHDLVAYARELQLSFTEAREVDVPRLGIA
jgi:hypothetical protein